MEFDVETLRVHTVSMNPQTNTVMDPKQWAQRIGQIPLESRSVSDFARVSECGCESGGPCCNAEIQLHMTNESISDSLKVYTDDIVASDSRVRPVHRTFAATFTTSGPKVVKVETSGNHTFSDGDLVCIIESSIGLPTFCRAINCLASTLDLQPLFPDQSFKISGASPWASVTSGRISNRQLL